MKKLLIIIAIIIPSLMKSQAHLGSTEWDIKSLHPEVTFKTGYTDDGDKYIMGDVGLGTYIYYFDNTTSLSYECLQVPNNMTAVNAQCEIYNKKYVIVSESSWKAYLEGGGRMTINLYFDEQYKLYVFKYTY